MARLSRLTLPGYPHHVIQRGNNRQALFVDTADYQKLLDLLLELSRKFSVAVHAYVLMSNHFHLLMTPSTEVGVPLLMQALGRSYVRYFNRVQQRTGTLWEGRYKSTLIQAEHHLLACMAYIDLNPVRAGMVDQARDYPWSSHGHYAGLRVDQIVSAHQLYWDLGNTPFAREAAYQELVQTGLPEQKREALTQATLRGWALGGADFVADLQLRTERRVARLRAGRPKRNGRKNAD